MDRVKDKGLGDKYVFFFTLDLPNYNYVFCYFQIALLLLCDQISQRLKADGIVEQFDAKVNGKVG